MQLRHGPIVRDEAIALAIHLEDRGHAMTADNGVLKVTNGSALTADDRSAIVREKVHLIAICGYVPPECR